MRGKTEVDVIIIQPNEPVMLDEDVMAYVRVPVKEKDKDGNETVVWVRSEKRIRLTRGQYVITDKRPVNLSEPVKGGT